jgi:cytochrome c-type biogenesis protein CcmH/NrfG
MEPSSTQGHFQLGLALLSANQANDAAGSFREAVKLKPDFGPAWYNLGVALSRSEKLREGAEAVAQSIRHNPERIESHLYLAELNLRLGATNDALRVLDQACPINPDDPRLRTLRLRLQPPSD